MLSDEDSERLVELDLRESEWETNNRKLYWCELTDNQLNVMILAIKVRIKALEENITFVGNDSKSAANYLDVTIQLTEKLDDLNFYMENKGKH